MACLGRFAPTPSGRMHLGNVFSAMMAWLSARSKGGEMLLRIEDLDTLRCPKENADILREDLRWLGLDWDYEQPCQSSRSAYYEEILSRLSEAGTVFPCWCTRGDLKNAPNAPHASDGHPIYPGTCRDLSPAERQHRMAAKAVTYARESGSPIRAAVGQILCETVSYAGCFIIAFLLIVIILTVIGNLPNLSYKLPRLDLVNDILGALLGVVTGLMFCAVLVWALKFMGMLIGSDTLASTRIGGWLLEKDFLPIVCPIGYDDNFDTYNINADDAACAIAKAVNAEKLAFLTDIEGVYKDPSDRSTLISELSVSEAEGLIHDGVIGGGMLPKLGNCIDAIENGVSRVHILDGRIAHCLLLEIFTNRGIGTAIIANDQERFYHE